MSDEYSKDDLVAAKMIQRYGIDMYTKGFRTATVRGGFRAIGVALLTAYATWKSPITHEGEVTIQTSLFLYGVIIFISLTLAFDAVTAMMPFLRTAWLWVRERFESKVKKESSND